MPNPRLLKAAWEDPTLKHVRRSDLLVLLALIQHTNKNADTVWPSVERLAEYTRFSERQVIRILAKLEEKQLIERDKRGRGRVYRMAPALRSAAGRTGDMHVTHGQTIGDKDVMPHMTPASSTHDKDVALSIKEDTKGSIDAQNGLAGWEEFWAAYPRKESKKDAKAAFRQTRKVRPPLPQLLAALRAFCKSDNWQREGGRFVPYPASWLRKERWRDMEPAAELEAAPSASVPSEDQWRRALVALIAEKYPDGDAARFRRWEDLPASLQAEVLEALKGAPADWPQLFRVYLLMNNETAPEGLESWDGLPTSVQHDLRGLADQMRRSPAPEGWAGVVDMLQEARELSGADDFTTWANVPLWLRAQVHLLLEKAQDNETETRREAA